VVNVIALCCNIRSSALSHGVCTFLIHVIVTTDGDGLSGSKYYNALVFIMDTQCVFCEAIICVWCRWNSVLSNLKAIRFLVTTGVLFAITLNYAADFSRRSNSVFLTLAIRSLHFSFALCYWLAKRKKLKYKSTNTLWY